MTKTSMKATDALEEAQRIAFASFVFQVFKCLKKVGLTIKEDKALGEYHTMFTFSKS